MKYPLVDVIWNDFYSMYGEYSKSDIKKRISQQCLRKTTGYKVFEDDDWIALANTVDREGKKHTFTDIFYCLKAGIIELKEYGD